MNTPQTPIMRKIKILDENERLIKTIYIPKAEEYTMEQIETALGRKMKKGEMMEFNS